MKKSDIVRIILLLTVYLGILFVFKNNVFHYRFDKNLINKYFLSQDIPHEVAGKRLFLSDDQIHIASGYLYVKGVSPIDYNFQHPPFIKYLFGLSTLFFNNPFYAQIILGAILIILTYYLGEKLFDSYIISSAACFLLIIDPLFMDISTSALLDLGQSVCLLTYMISMFFFPKKIWRQGLTLGLLLTSKFWGGSVFFIGLIFIYLLYKKQLNIKKYLTHLLIAFFVICAVYGKTFINLHGRFNIIFFELKTLKYWLNHSVASNFGSFLIMFIAGFYKSWWGKKEILRVFSWSFLWPISLIASLYYGAESLLKKKINVQFLISILPFAYLVYLGFQAPFPRYFIVILPFCYLILSQNIMKLINLFFSQIN